MNEKKFRELFNSNIDTKDDIMRLRKDVFYILTHSHDLNKYTVEDSNKCWGQYDDELKAEEIEQGSRKKVELEKKEKFGNGEYTKTFMEILVPTIGGVPHEWTETLKHPQDPETEFDLKRAVGSGSYYPDKSRMVNEILSRWLNNGLHFGISTNVRKPHGTGYLRWDLDIGFKLRPQK